MIRVGLYTLVGLLAVNAESGVQHRLQVEQDVKGHRRRNVLDAVTKPFEFVFSDDFWVPIGDVFVDGWGEVEDFFTEDMVEWFETDFVEFVEFISPVGFVNDVDWVEGWNDFIHGMEAAWTWTENAAVSVWEWGEQIVCDVDEFGDKVATHTICSECIKDTCNDALGGSTIEQIDAANAVAFMDMNDEFDPLFDGCASAMDGCPALNDCKELAGLSEETQQYVAPQLAQCSLCYDCLLFGSTTEGCKIALDAVMPNNCQGCSDSEQQMYNMFYSCSSLKSLHDSIWNLGQSYAKGGKGHKSNDNLCDNCLDCSDYSNQLQKTCDDWTLISKPYANGGWDCMPPEVPPVLFPGGTTFPTRSPTPGPPTDRPTPNPTPVPTRPPVVPTPNPTPAPTLVGQETCITAMQPRTVGNIRLGPGACCRCLSEEYPWDWDDGSCCGHCPQCNSGGR